MPSHRRYAHRGMGETLRWAWESRPLLHTFLLCGNLTGRVALPGAPDELTQAMFSNRFIVLVGARFNPMLEEVMTEASQLGTCPKRWRHLKTLVLS
jgi:hypothetical protein